jgi:hypothetical protein
MATKLISRSRDRVATITGPSNSRPFTRTFSPAFTSLSASGSAPMDDCHGKLSFAASIVSFVIWFFPDMTPDAVSRIPSFTIASVWPTALAWS